MCIPLEAMQCGGNTEDWENNGCEQGPKNVREIERREVVNILVPATMATLLTAQMHFAFFIAKLW